MEIFTIPAYIIMGIVAVNFILAWTLPLVIAWHNYVFRGDAEVWWYQEKKANTLGLGDSEEWGLIDSVVTILVCFILIPLIGLGVALLGWYDVEAHQGFLTYLQLMVAGYALFVPFIVAALSLPFTRWLVDVAKNLKIQRSTGDSVRIARLEKEIAELKEKN